MKTITAEIAALIAWMIATYATNSAADEYWFGFVVDGLAYVVPNIAWATLTSFFKPGYTSHKKGHKFVLRVKASAEECRALIPSAVCLGAESVLTERVANKGDGLEIILTERYTPEQWVKHDSAKFFERGDLRIDGKEVQVKFNGATLTTEDFLRKTFG